MSAIRNLDVPGGTVGGRIAETTNPCFKSFSFVLIPIPITGQTDGQ
ncbi:hypothetical protein [Wolbachia endosymbiont (group A) of Alloplasta piceator]